MEAQFRSGRSRHILWSQIYNKMRMFDSSMCETLQNVQKKFNNLMLTYKRIKLTDHGVYPPKWEFFEDFDEGLGQFSETQNDDAQSPVRYIKVERLDDDSVSFSSDDCDTRPVRPLYQHLVACKPEPTTSPESKPIIICNDLERNRIRSQIIVENVPQTKKRKLIETGYTTGPKLAKTTPVEPSGDCSWFREYVKMNERKEQLRHDSLMELERKKLEIETKKVQMLRELVDVVKKFVNK